MDKDDIVINDKKRKDLHGRAKDWEAWVGEWVGVFCVLVLTYPHFYFLYRITQRNTFVKTYSGP